MTITNQTNPIYLLTKKLSDNDLLEVVVSFYNSGIITPEHLFFENEDNLLNHILSEIKSFKPTSANVEQFFNIISYMSSCKDEQWVNNWVMDSENVFSRFSQLCDDNIILKLLEKFDLENSPYINQFIYNLFLSTKTKSIEYIRENYKSINLNSIFFYSLKKSGEEFSIEKHSLAKTASLNSLSTAQSLSKFIYLFEPSISMTMSSKFLQESLQMSNEELQKLAAMPFSSKSTLQLQEVWNKLQQAQKNASQEILVDAGNITSKFFQERVKVLQDGLLKGHRYGRNYDIKRCKTEIGDAVKFLSHNKEVAKSSMSEHDIIAYNKTILWACGADQKSLKVLLGKSGIEKLNMKLKWKGVSAPSALLKEYHFPLFKKFLKQSKTKLKDVFYQDSFHLLSSVNAFLLPQVNIKSASQKKQLCDFFKDLVKTTDFTFKDKYSNNLALQYLLLAKTRFRNVKLKKDPQGMWSLNIEAVSKRDHVSQESNIVEFLLMLKDKGVDLKEKNAFNLGVEDLLFDFHVKSTPESYYFNSTESYNLFTNGYPELGIRPWSEKTQKEKEEFLSLLAARAHRFGDKFIQFLLFIEKLDVFKPDDDSLLKVFCASALSNPEFLTKLQSTRSGYFSHFDVLLSTIEKEKLNALISLEQNEKQVPAKKFKI